MSATAAEQRPYQHLHRGANNYHFLYLLTFVTLWSSSQILGINLHLWSGVERHKYKYKSLPSGVYVVECPIRLFAPQKKPTYGYTTKWCRSLAASHAWQAGANQHPSCSKAPTRVYP